MRENKKIFLTKNLDYCKYHTTKKPEHSPRLFIFQFSHLQLFNNLTAAVPNSSIQSADAKYETKTER